MARCRKRPTDTQFIEWNELIVEMAQKNFNAKHSQLISSSSSSSLSAEALLWHGDEGVDGGIEWKWYLMVHIFTSYCTRDAERNKKKWKTEKKSRWFGCLCKSRELCVRAGDSLFHSRTFLLRRFSCCSDSHCCSYVFTVRESTQSATNRRKSFFFFFILFDISVLAFFHLNPAIINIRQVPSVLRRFFFSPFWWI